MNNDRKSQDQFDGFGISTEQGALMREYAQIEMLTRDSTVEELKLQQKEIERAHEIIDLLKQQDIALRWEPAIDKKVWIHVWWEVLIDQKVISIPALLLQGSMYRSRMRRLRLSPYLSRAEGWREVLLHAFYLCIGLLPSSRETELILALSLTLDAFAEAAREASSPPEFEDMKRKVMDVVYQLSWDEQVTLVYSRDSREAFLSDVAIYLSRLQPLYQRASTRVIEVARKFCSREASIEGRSRYLSMLHGVVLRRSFSKMRKAFPLEIGSGEASPEEIEQENGLYELLCMLLAKDGERA